MTLPGQQLKRDYCHRDTPPNRAGPGHATEKASPAAPRKGPPLKVGCAGHAATPSGDLSPWLTWGIRSAAGLRPFGHPSPGRGRFGWESNWRGLPENAEMRFSGARIPDTFGPFTARSIRAQQAGSDAAVEPTPALFWSPVIEGETARVEALSTRAGGKWFPCGCPRYSTWGICFSIPTKRTFQKSAARRACNIDVKLRDGAQRFKCRSSQIIYSDARAVIYARAPCQR